MSETREGRRAYYYHLERSYNFYFYLSHHWIEAQVITR